MRQVHGCHAASRRAGPTACRRTLILPQPLPPSAAHLELHPVAVALPAPPAAVVLAAAVGCGPGVRAGAGGRVSRRRQGWRQASSRERHTLSTAYRRRHLRPAGCPFCTRAPSCRRPRTGPALTRHQLALEPLAALPLPLVERAVGVGQPPLACARREDERWAGRRGSAPGQHAPASRAAAPPPGSRAGAPGCRPLAAPDRSAAPSTGGHRGPLASPPAPGAPCMRSAAHSPSYLSLAGK